ncbi:MAG TPA: MBL fold metallo-hydrolase [Thermoanaerobaculia bacterium]|nr:MBL fold metallo-hydrolase [Thermoanaerobaculia bacterium]
MRKSLITFLSIMGIAISAAAAASGPLETSVERAQAMLIKETLAEGVYVFRAPSDLDYWTSTNSVVIVNDDDVVVFDSCTRAVTARAVIAEIRKLTPKPVRVLINSHWHQDHWSGNAEYAKAFPGLRIISTVETRAYMSRMGPAFFNEELKAFGLTRMRDTLAEAIRTGKLSDGTPLTPEIRARKERSLAEAIQFSEEIDALPRLLPNFTYENEMRFQSGGREFRLMSMTGDASASTVLFLPAEKIVVTGDVLVSPEDGHGPPPWTTTSYAVSRWLDSLHRLDALDAAVIVPGQGPAMHDKTYLRRTIRLFSAVIDQVHAALAAGLATLPEVRKAVNVDSIGLDYMPGGTALNDDFHLFVSSLVKKTMQDSLDGAINEK